MAKVSVSPLSSLFDDKNVISLTGLAKHQPVTLYAQLRGESGKFFHSCAHYVADDEGCFVLNKQPSLGGSYTGIHPMGLLWSLQAGPGYREGFRLIKRDVTTPFEVDLRALEGHLSLEECQHGLETKDIVIIAECKFFKWYMGPNVQRVPVREGRIRGTLFIPAGPGPFPGILDIQGTPGGLVEYKAALLASHGFASLALAYYNHDDLQKTTVGLEMEYFEEALEWLIQHPKVQPDGVGVHAFSKGAQIALMLASLRAEVSAVVAIGVTYGVLRTSLTHRGKAMEFVPYHENNRSFDKDGACCFRNCVNDYSDEFGFQVENIKGQILLVFGEDDQLYNVEKHKNQLLARCVRYGKDVRVLSYPGTGHLIDPPYYPLFTKVYFPDMKCQVLNGGRLVEHAYAQEDYWNQAIEFFDTNVPRKSKL